MSSGSAPSLANPAPGQAPFPWNGCIVAVGASAGGAEALMEIVARLPADGPPIMIVQHIPAMFVAGLAKRLDQASRAQVEVANAGAPLVPGRIYLAAADRHLVLSGGPGAWCCGLQRSPPLHGFRPSADALFASMVQAGAKGVGVILSGLGRDGAAGLVQMREAGARTLGQDAASSVVYGMPRAAMLAGGVERQGPPARIARELLQLCRHRAGGTR